MDVFLPASVDRMSGVENVQRSAREPFENKRICGKSIFLEYYQVTGETLFSSFILSFNLSSASCFLDGHAFLQEHANHAASLAASCPPVAAWAALGFLKLLALPQP